MIVYGHRGARFEAPENTVLGFRHAHATGVDGVEFDVRMSRDDELVVIHDETVDRTTDGSGKVSDLDLEELAGLDAAAQDDERGGAVGIPRLAEVLEATDDFPHLEIELKRDSAGRDGPLVDRLLSTVSDSVAGRAVFTSFHPDLLVLLRARRPDLALGLIGRYDHAGWTGLARLLGVRRAGVNGRYVAADVVHDLRRAGVFVLGWPCNTAEDLAALRAAGITEAVTSDAPSTIMELLSTVQ